MDDDDLYGGYTATSSYKRGERLLLPWAKPAGGEEDEFDMGGGGPPPAPVGGMRQPTALPGRPPPSGPVGRPLGTAMGGGPGGPGDGLRPMTSNKGAGYSSTRKMMGNIGSIGVSKGPAPPLLKKTDDGPEEQCKEMEAKVNELLEESAEAGRDGDASRALEQAKEAGKKERQLSRMREQNGFQDQQNIDLTYAVIFNLAHQYHNNKQHQESLQTYQTIVKNKSFTQSGRLRVNMGNIYFEQGKFPNAIKMYRMALDQVPPTAKELRFKVMRNIGIAFLRMGQYGDAVQSFGDVMDNEPDLVTGFNLVICYYALGDREKMKKSFVALLALRAYEPDNDDDEGEENKTMDDVDDLMADDGLKGEIRARQLEAQKKILMAAKLIGPKIGATMEKGYEYLADEMNRAGYAVLANELEMEKALGHLKAKNVPGNFEEGKRCLRDFEKKEHTLKAKAATNLSFLYFQEGDTENAAKYADLSVNNDRYDARALVNRGNCLYRKGDLEGAKMVFLEAVGVEADCVEAIYNLGLMNKELGALEDALVAFKKVHTIIPDNVEAIFQLGNVYDLMGNYPAAIKQFEILNTKVTHDPGILSRLGAIYARMEDEGKALHYYTESHRVYPVNMDVISWLGAFHVKSEVYEKAMPFFDLASEIQPSEVKWQLMVASCHRRVGAYNEALAKYGEIHANHPENVECLRYLVHIYTDLGRKDEVHDYVVKLRKAERAQGEAAATMAAAVATRSAVGDDGMGMGGTNGVNGGGGMGGGYGGGGGMGGGGMENSGGGGGMMPSSPSPSKGNKSMGGGDDEWGGGELGDDLLPGM